jgi:hypothetical protein
MARRKMYSHRGGDGTNLYPSGRLQLPLYQVGRAVNLHLQPGRGPQSLPLPCRLPSSWLCPPVTERGACVCESECVCVDRPLARRLRMKEAKNHQSPLLIASPVWPLSDRVLLICVPERIGPPACASASPGPSCYSCKSSSQPRNLEPPWRGEPLAAMVSRRACKFAVERGDK